MRVCTSRARAVPLYTNEKTRVFGALQRPKPTSETPPSQVTTLATLTYKSDQAWPHTTSASDAINTSLGFLGGKRPPVRKRAAQDTQLTTQ